MFTAPFHRPAYVWTSGQVVPTVGGPTEEGPESRAVPNAIVLDGRVFPVEVKDARYGAQDTFRDTVVTGNEDSNALFNARGAWQRYQHSWHHGAGTELADFDDPPDGYHFLESVGINWIERSQLTLVPSTTNVQDVDSSTPLLCRVNDRVWLADGDNLYYSDDLDVWFPAASAGGAPAVDDTDSNSTSSSGLTIDVAALSPGAGDVILIWAIHDDTSGVPMTGTYSGGNYELLDSYTYAGDVIDFILLGKLAEGGTADNVTITGNGTDQCYAIAIIAAGQHGVDDVTTDIYVAKANGSSTTPDCPATPTLPSGDYRVFAWVGADDDDEVASPWGPSTYTEHEFKESAATLSSCMCYLASKGVTGTTGENPGTMSLAATEEWIASTVAVPGVTAGADPGGTIQALSTDGVDLYVATTTVTKKYVAGSTNPTAFSTPITGNCTNVGFVANRLLVAKDNIIYEAAGTGALTTIRTHFQPEFEWTTIFNIGSRIYIGGFAGSRSELYTVTTDSAGALVQSQEAAPLPAGEKLRSAHAYAGIVALCTSRGVRIAEVSGDGTLTYGPLIDELGDVRCATSDEAWLYVGWSDMGTSRSGVARLRLDIMDEPLRPAWGGWVYESDSQAAVTGVARMDERTCFVVSAGAAYSEDTNDFVGQGELTSPEITFGAVEPKGLLNFTAEFAPLATGESIEVSVYNDQLVLIQAGSESEVGATSMEVDLGGEQVSVCTVVLILSGPGTSTPTLHRWKLRGYPIPDPVYQWLLPLNVYETVVINDGEGEIMAIDVTDTHEWIAELYGSRRLTLMRWSDLVHRVRVDNYEWRPAKWTDDGAIPQGQLVVQLVEA